MLLHDFDLVVPESQVKDYKQVVPNANAIVPIPDDVVGLGAVRNWIMDHYEEEILIMMDDDIKSFVSLLQLKPEKIEDVDVIECILLNCAQNCIDAGMTLFSFNQCTTDVRKYRHSQPFNLSSWVGTVVGVVGRKHRFTEVNKLKVDADYALKTLLHERVLWIDQRFSFVNIRDRNRGGNTEFRTQQAIEDEIKFLEEKWKKHIRISRHKS
ncbi:hypothetical protein ACQVTS_32915, partial [Bacillus mycoides]|uniref:GREB1-related protein n=1 Tax=Bacillus mycoides TaxID=1405 RepID=UPI003D651B20